VAFDPLAFDSEDFSAEAFDGLGDTPITPVMLTYSDGTGGATRRRIKRIEVKATVLSLAFSFSYGIDIERDIDDDLMAGIAALMEEFA